MNQKTKDECINKIKNAKNLDDLDKIRIFVVNSNESNILDLWYTEKFICT